MKVYIVEKGEYEDRGVVAVFASLKSAQAQYPNDTWTDSDEGTWSNDGDGRDYIVISEYEVEE